MMRLWHLEWMQGTIHKERLFCVCESRPHCLLQDLVLLVNQWALKFPCFTTWPESNLTKKNLKLAAFGNFLSQ